MMMFILILIGNIYYITYIKQNFLYQNLFKALNGYLDTKKRAYKSAKIYSNVK